MKQTKRRLFVLSLMLKRRFRAAADEAVPHCVELDAEAGAARASDESTHEPGSGGEKHAADSVILSADPATQPRPVITKRCAAASIEDVEGAEGTMSRGGSVDERTPEKSRQRDTAPQAMQLKG